MPLINGADRGLRWFVEDVWGQFDDDHDRPGAPLFPSERKCQDGSCSRATADVFRRSLGSAATPDTLHRTPSLIRRPERIGIPRSVRPLALAIARGTGAGSGRSEFTDARRLVLDRLAARSGVREIDGERPRATGGMGVPPTSPGRCWDQAAGPGVVTRGPLSLGSHAVRARGPGPRVRKNS